jgi:FkbM family methyltransferase
MKRWDERGGGAAVRHLALGLARLYTYYFPVRRGKYRVMTAALRFAGSPGGEVVRCKTADVRDFHVELSSSPGMYDTVYFLGEYERFITRIVSSMVRPGDRCIDVGANYGWYTLLMSYRCGNTGEVHAFEPVPRTFRMLRRNFETAGSPRNIVLNNTGVADAPGHASMHVFAGLPHGHSSLSDMGRKDSCAVECELTTLDEYLGNRPGAPIRVVKCDVEGAELKVLQGATSLLRQLDPPIWIIEMARGTARPFGYGLNDLLGCLRNGADYEFYAVDEVRSKVRRIDRFADEDIGANVLCVPAERFRDRLSGVPCTRD